MLFDMYKEKFAAMQTNTILRFFSFILFFIATSATAQLVNGNFATGNLNGWTVFNDTNGTTGPASVVPFDIAGTGTATNCAQFEVGSAVVGLGCGGGISQSVSLAAGQLTIFLNLAAYNPDPTNANGDAGTFELVLDGNAVVTNSLGGIDIFQTIRSTINYSASVTAGTHQIAIDMQRKYSSNSDANDGKPLSPYQYLANIAISGSAVLPLLNIQAGHSKVVLSWGDSTFGLQAAPLPMGVFTNIPGAASPFTNATTGTERFFRLSK
jgi:hypothetical protein